LENKTEEKRTICAVDSVLFMRGGLKKPVFKAPLGVAVTISDYEDFKITYDQTLQKLFEQYSLNREKYVYSASNIMSLFSNLAESDQFFEDFLKEIVPSIRHLDIFYSYFPKNQQSSISIYVEGPTPVERLTPIKFIERKLLNAYPHYCVWKYVDAHPEFKDVPVFVDHFQSEVTLAWLTIQNLHNIFVFLKGDECNCAISTADVMLKVINNRLYRKRKGLYPDDLKEILPELNNKITSHFLGPKYLNYLKPRFPKQIKVDEKIKHPIIYLIREPNSSAVSRKAVEYSPLWNCIQNFAFQLDGCAKFFDPATDFRRIREGDIMTYLGPEGQRAALLYSKMGYKIKVVPPEKILSEYVYKTKK